MVTRERDDYYRNQAVKVYNKVARHIPPDIRSRIQLEEPNLVFYWETYGASSAAWIVSITKPVEVGKEPKDITEWIEKITLPLPMPHCSMGALEYFARYLLGVGLLNLTYRGSFYWIVFPRSSKGEFNRDAPSP